LLEIIIPQIIVCWIHSHSQCFFFPKGFCDIAKGGNHPKDNLAIFGYIPDMKVEREEKKKTESFYIVGYPLELIAKNLAVRFFFLAPPKIW
jgi:hypothetical protein